MGGYGQPSLVYYPIQLRMGNQYPNFAIGRLENVEVDLVGVNNLIAFEVIETMDKIDPFEHYWGYIVVMRTMLLLI